MRNGTWGKANLFFTVSSPYETPGEKIAQQTKTRHYLFSDREMPLKMDEQ